MGRTGTVRSAQLLQPCPHQSINPLFPAAPPSTTSRKSRTHIRTKDRSETPRSGKRGDPPAPSPTAPVVELPGYFIMESVIPVYDIDLELSWRMRRDAPGSRHVAWGRTCIGDDRRPGGPEGNREKLRSQPGKLTREG